MATPPFSTPPDFPPLTTGSPSHTSTRHNPSSGSSTPTLRAPSPEPPFPSPPRSCSSSTTSNTNESTPTSTTTATGTGPGRYPPYWHPHQRSVSNISYISITSHPTHRPPIALEDHSLAHSPQTAALWARAVSIDSYVLVGTGSLGAGSYVVWCCTVETLEGGPMKMMKRYSEFDALRRQLLATFPDFRGALPELPPKSVISRFRERFLEKRRAGLQYFLNCVLLNPEFAGSPVLKDFLFSQ